VKNDGYSSERQVLEAVLFTLPGSIRTGRTPENSAVLTSRWRPAKVGEASRHGRGPRPGGRRTHACPRKLKQQRTHSRARVLHVRTAGAIAHLPLTPLRAPIHKALFSSLWKPKNFQDSPSHRIFRHMHETLNIDENKK
jgi:hypothetical protein